MVEVTKIEIVIGDKFREPKNHAEVVMQLLRNNNFKIFAEIGVFRGETSDTILYNLEKQIREYWAVDQWKHLGRGHRRERRRSAEIRATVQQWEEMYIGCCALMLKYWQLRVLKMTSDQASSIFPDGYFDMIYIDADHKYDHVLRDIGAWLSKVRAGGILSGHDYGGNRWPGVKKAVDEVFSEEYVKLYPSGVWVIEK